MLELCYHYSLHVKRNKTKNEEQLLQGQFLKNQITNKEEKNLDLQISPPKNRKRKEKKKKNKIQTEKSTFVLHKFYIYL